MKIYILLFILISLAVDLSAQKLKGQALIDSLISELPKIKEDTSGVNLLISLSFRYANINPEKGIEYGEKGLKIAKKIGWNVGLAGCNNNLGINYFNLSDYPKALEF